MKVNKKYMKNGAGQNLVRGLHSGNGQAVGWFGRYGAVRSAVRDDEQFLGSSVTDVGDVEAIQARHTIKRRHRHFRAIALRLQYHSGE